MIFPAGIRYPFIPRSLDVVTMKKIEKLRLAVFASEALVSLFAPGGFVLVSNGLCRRL